LKSKSSSFSSVVSPFQFPSSAESLANSPITVIPSSVSGGCPEDSPADSPAAVSSAVFFFVALSFTALSSAFLSSALLSPVCATLCCLPYSRSASLPPAEA